ncbi:MAG: ATP-binding protein [Planctomycetes bacterium]|nr:ATP-binding protein [Planctomycetota bacterium]
MPIEGSRPVEITVPSHPQYMTILRHSVFSMCTFAGFEASEAKKIVLAVDEAVTNVIKYAYEMDCTQEIQVSLAAHEDGLEIKIRDRGKPVDGATLKSRDLTEVRPGGLGIHFIRSIMTDVCYKPIPTGGTELTLLKKRAAIPAKES